MAERRKSFYFIDGWKFCFSMATIPLPRTCLKSSSTASLSSFELLWSESNLSSRLSI